MSLLVTPVGAEGSNGGFITPRLQTLRGQIDRLQGMLTKARTPERMDKVGRALQRLIGIEQTLDRPAMVKHASRQTKSEKRETARADAVGDLGDED